MSVLVPRTNPPGVTTQYTGHWAQRNVKRGKLYYFGSIISGISSCRESSDFINQRRPASDGSPSAALPFRRGLDAEFRRFPAKTARAG